LWQHFSDSEYKNVAYIRYGLLLFADYFGEGMNIWVKNHPSNIYNPLKYWIEDASFISGQVPFELAISAGKDEGIQFDRVVTFSSSAILCVKNNVDQLISFQNAEDNDSFLSERRFVDIHKYYVVIRLLDVLNKNTIYTIGTEQRTLQHLYMIYHEKEICAKKISGAGELFDTYLHDAVFIIDRLDDEISEEDILAWLESAGDNAVVFFMSDKFFNESKLWQHPGINEYFFPLPIEIRETGEPTGFFGNGSFEYPLKETVEVIHREQYLMSKKKEREMIYMFTKEEAIAKNVLETVIEKKLAHCGLCLDYNPSGTDYREVMLQGIIQQLETQVIRLESENEELRQNAVNQKGTYEEMINKVKELSQMIANV
jgi:hypothetical protein